MLLPPRSFNRMSPAERGVWVSRLGTRLGSLRKRQRELAAETEEAARRLRELQAEREKVDKGIENVHASLADFDPAELQKIGINLR